MNFNDRCKIQRQDEAPGGGIVTVTLFETMPCRFEVLTAKQFQDSWAGVQATYTSNFANLHLPLTIEEYPTTAGGTLSLTRYRITMLSPVVKGLTATNVWTLQTKRMARNHMTYLMKV